VHAYTRATYTNISTTHFTWRGERSDDGMAWSDFMVVEAYRSAADENTTGPGSAQRYAPGKESHGRNLTDRQPHDKLRTAAHALAANVNRPAVQFHNAMGDGQSDPEPTAFTLILLRK
jgi:hypothetical protein